MRKDGHNHEDQPGEMAVPLGKDITSVIHVVPFLF